MCKKKDDGTPLSYFLTRIFSPVGDWLLIILVFSVTMDTWLSTRQCLIKGERKKGGLILQTGGQKFNNITGYGYIL